MFLRGGSRNKNIICLYCNTLEIEFTLYPNDTIEQVLDDIMLEFKIENIDFLKIVIKCIMGKRIKSIL